MTHHSGSPRAALTLGLVPGGDRFEDFFDKIGVSLDTFRDEFTGGWLFNYIEALRLTGVRTVLFFVSARTPRAVRFQHRPSGAMVWVLPSPGLHERARSARLTRGVTSPNLLALRSYLATPLRGLARVIRQEGCDALLCQEYEAPRFDACVLLGRLLRIPVFATFQGAHPARTLLEGPIRRLSVRSCAGLIIANEAEAARVQRHYDVEPRRVRRLPNPVDVILGGTAQRAATRAMLGIGRTTTVVGWHGRVQVETKGLDVLFDAWDRICTRADADVLLLLIGSGRNADFVRQRVSSNPRVRWIDRYVLDRAELFAYLSAADIYAIPSRREGFAVSALEAMACGLPVVGSNVPGVADLLPRGEEDGGILVPPADSAALADAIASLLAQPERSRRLGDAARRRMQREFSVEALGPQLRAFLFPAASPAPRPPAEPDGV